MSAPIVVERVNAQKWRWGSGVRIVRWDGAPNAEIVKPEIACLLIGKLGRLGKDATVSSYCVECGEPSYPMAELAGAPEDLCYGCAGHLQRAAEAEPKRAAAVASNGAWLAARLAQTGLADMAAVVKRLGITPENQAGKEPPAGGKCKKAVLAVRAYLDQPQHRPMFLAGGTGTGKTTAAAWAVWKTDGVFLPPLVWRSVPRDKVLESLGHVIRRTGCVVIDNALDVNGNEARDNRGHLEVLAEVCRARDEARRPTIITTQSSAMQIAKAYDETAKALIRRATEPDGLDGRPLGGFVWCSAEKDDDMEER